jgi:O-acetyl-ADP-ribose deacetylase (regulator of RNase III)
MSQREERTCFVIMPFGEKTDVQGDRVNFDGIYDEFIVPTIEAAGLTCERCDRIDEAGNIHRRMFQLIWTADVALVDLSLLNPNVFYELGIRHALRRSSTILVRRKGTGVPFNIASLNVIEYDETDDRSQEGARQKILNSIKAGEERGAVDNYVSEVLNLRIDDVPKPVGERRVFSYAIDGLQTKRLCVVTGDLRNIQGVDVWVNSENTNMQMARYYDFSVSSVIRYEGAEKTVTGHVKRDMINDELERLMDGQYSVPPAHVIPTSSAQLEKTNGVKRIFHVAAVEGGIGQGYRVVESVERCVVNALKLADSHQFESEGLRSILFPLLGMGTRLRSQRDTVKSLFTAALGYLRDYPQSRIEVVYFLAWSESELDLCRSIMAGERGVSESLA